ncbi:hypothetical protein PSTG_17938 [Puccinia striiformis f. sp. tritici PST-78]|uniref:DUF8207 domain-containing protein n=1 Tax=Puccinia striiformis f. sp. tritici PST-78 TaxID=1165861 RepID=A0A0L0UPD0_9BASI|nr:hypothetical protein PSTG_17938 [Puccinia striiformis f. sp. tritici PST-78]
MLEGLSKVESSVNDVKEVAIKTDNDIKKMLIPTPYKPRNAEILGLLSTEVYENIKTPKSSPIKTKYNSLIRQFNLDNIILNGKERILTPGIWCLLTRKDVPKQSEYNNEDFNKYAKILIETDSIYQNNDRSTGKDKSSGDDRYMKLISPIWKAAISNKNAKENKTPTIPKENLNPTIPIENKGAGLMNYTNNEIE